MSHLSSVKHLSGLFTVYEFSESVNFSDSDPKFLSGRNLDSKGSGHGLHFLANLKKAIISRSVNPEIRKEIPTKTGYATPTMANNNNDDDDDDDDDNDD